MARYTITPDHLIALPVFPLPNLVFFPFTALPLHIFEPRYRAMTEHCLKAEWPLALVRIKPGYEHLSPSRPPLDEIATAGFIVEHHRLPDGRFNVLLGGLQRVKLEYEDTGSAPFRRFMTSPLDDVWPEDRSVLTEPMQTLRACLTCLDAQAQRKRNEPMFTADLFEIEDAAVMTNALATALVEDTDARQMLLANPDVAERLDFIITHLAQLIAVNTTDPEQVH